MWKKEIDINKKMHTDILIIIVRFNASHSLPINPNVYPYVNKDRHTNILITIVRLNASHSPIKNKPLCISLYK